MRKRHSSKKGKKGKRWKRNGRGKKNFLNKIEDLIEEIRNRIYCKNNEEVLSMN
jgi:hypothetical protein